MKAIIQNYVLILEVGTSQYIQLVSSINHDTKYYRKWLVDEEVIVDSKFSVNYCHSIEIEVNGSDCIIDDFDGEYYLVVNYTF